MELFKENGHLTNDGIKAIISGDLNELQSLEAAEHLSFCDLCLTKYSNMLENAPLLAPTTDFAPTVKAFADNRRLKYFITRIGTVAAGIAITMTLWSGGVFTNLIPVADFGKTVSDTQQINSVLTPIVSFVTNIGSSIGNVFHTTNVKNIPVDVNKKNDTIKHKESAENQNIKRENALKEQQQKREDEAKKQQEEEKVNIEKLFQESPAKKDFLQDKDKLESLKYPQKNIGDKNK